MDLLAETIRSIPIFSALTREDIAKVLGKMEECSFGAGTTIFRQGDEGEAFYVIQSGAVQVVLESFGARAEVIAVLGPQDWFGEMALLSGEPRSATINTLKETILWRLSREAWNELIEKHPTWLLQFCATLSKRLSRADQQYSIGRHAFTSLAEEFYNSQSVERQAFFRRASLLDVIDTRYLDLLLQTGGAVQFLTELENSRFPLLRRLDADRYELHVLFCEFLREKLVTVEGQPATQELRRRIAAQYEALGLWREAVHHFKEAQDWTRVIELLVAHREQFLNGLAPFLKDVLESIPHEHFFADAQLVHIKATTFAHLGDLPGAAKTYKEALSQRAQGTVGGETITRYLSMADALERRGEYAQAMNWLRSALNLLEQETSNWAESVADPYAADPAEASVPSKGRLTSRIRKLLARKRALPGTSRGNWFGAILGLVVGGYLWFGNPPLNLEPSATRLLGLLSFTVIYGSLECCPTMAWP